MREEGEDWELPDLSFMGDLKRLKARAEAELRATPNPDKPPSRLDGVDRSGSVQVTVDLDGKVQHVEILDDWTEHLSSEELPKSIFQAYMIAARNATRVNSLANFAAEAAEPTRLHRQPDPSEADAGIPDTSDEHWSDAIEAAINHVDAQLQRIEELESGGHERSPERAVSSPSGCVTVVLRGATIVGLKGDPTRIERTGHEVLLQDVLAAFRRAQGYGSGRSSQGRTG